MWWLKTDERLEQPQNYETRPYLLYFCTVIQADRSLIEKARSFRFAAVSGEKAWSRNFLFTPLRGYFRILILGKAASNARLDCKITDDFH